MCKVSYEVHTMNSSKMMGDFDGVLNFKWLFSQNSTSSSVTDGRFSPFIVQRSTKEGLLRLSLQRKTLSPTTLSSRGRHSPLSQETWCLACASGVDTMDATQVSINFESNIEIIPKVAGSEGLALSLSSKFVLVIAKFQAPVIGEIFLGILIG
jgi:hypothetical protein